MKNITILIVVLAAVALLAPGALAEHHTPEDRGKIHFENPRFAGGQVACSMCHPNGAGLQAVTKKSTFRVAGKVQHSLEEAVNACIVAASKGKAIPVDSPEMEEIVSYIKTLVK